ESAVTLTWEQAHPRAAVVGAQCRSGGDVERTVGGQEPTDYNRPWPGAGVVTGLAAERAIASVQSHGDSIAALPACSRDIEPAVAIEVAQRDRARGVADRAVGRRRLEHPVAPVQEHADRRRIEGCAGADYVERAVSIHISDCEFLHEELARIHDQ